MDAGGIPQVAPQRSEVERAATMADIPTSDGVVLVQFIYNVKGDRTFKVNGREYRFGSGKNSLQRMVVKDASVLIAKWPHAFKMIQG